MTHSKTFLALTTCCLVIAGAVAVKVSHFGAIAGNYFTTGGIASEAFFLAHTMVPMAPPAFMNTSPVFR